MTGTGENTIPTAGMGAGGCLVRVGWMLFGTPILLFSAIWYKKAEIAAGRAWYGRAAMKIADILRPEVVITDMGAPTGEAAVAQLVSALAKTRGVDAEVAPVWQDAPTSPVSRAPPPGVPEAARTTLRGG